MEELNEDHELSPQLLTPNLGHKGSSRHILKILQNYVIHLGPEPTERPLKRINTFPVSLLAVKSFISVQITTHSWVQP